MDVSAYEKATIIQDLNQPWPDSLRERFSLVIDAGTLEHVFNFPVAIRSIMEAIAPGGHFLCITPANNQMGHGFYQFSPELYFRVFAAENGFAIEKVIVYEQPWKGIWYEVANPSEIRSRVELVNTRPVYMIVYARKIASVDVLAQAPVQSDYPLMYWQAGPGGEAAGVERKPGASAIRNLAPEWVASWYRKLRPFRPQYFKKVRS
jgi:SAM-dependent methyltransferase